MSLPRANRLNLRLERDRVSKKGKTLHSRHFTLVIAPQSESSSTSPRFGILISKKTAKLAIDRNRLRRRVLEVLDKLIPNLPVADYMIIPRSQVLDLPNSEIISDLSSLLKK